MNQVAAVGQNPTAREQPEDSVSIATIAAELAKMNARLTNMERSRSRMRRDGYRHRQASRSSSRRRAPGTADRLCSYHFRYRHRAHRCIPPCAWKSKPAAEGNKDDRAKLEN
ncbi:hypothetical protein PYW08_013027 [Mythimna loreyi]|uniref:Uncharacterized protein n=1 Tax=Mythimna loreyi TaxID=667449 RepID=A0ACC2PYW3_9NEOP|nr:hypothetical protein PYW08_013027 [Mythimna loreyi]